MTTEQKEEITKISQEFSKPFGEINGSGWLIVDPLSAYLNFCGWENSLFQLHSNERHPHILVMLFKDGTQFIPAGADLKPIEPHSENWMWID